MNYIPFFGSFNHFCLGLPPLESPPPPRCASPAHRLTAPQDFVLSDRSLVRSKRCHAMTYIEVLPPGANAVANASAALPPEGR